HGLRARAAAELEAERGAVGAWIRRAREPGRVEANDLSVAHQIAPAFDDLHLVPPLAKHVPDVVAKSILEPQRAGLLAPGSPEEPARCLDRRLWIESAIDDARDEGRLRLRLALTAHGAVDEARVSVDEIHGWDQGVRRLLARRQAIHVPRIEREERAPVLKEDAGVARDHARA